METRGLVVLATWISIAIISSVVFWIGGVNLTNYIFVGLLVFVGFLTTFGVPFGLGPESKPEVELLNELNNIEMRLERLTEMVEEIKKEIEA